MKFEDEKIDFTKNVLNFQTLVLFQIYKTTLWLSNITLKEDIETAERHMRVLKEILRPDTNYTSALSLLNEEFEGKIKKASDRGDKELIFNLQIDYSIEHFGILMELLKRRGYVILTKGTVVFQGIENFDQTTINVKNDK